MADQLMMPKLGFDMAEGRLIDWKIKVGDQVKKGDVIADIETDKATIEIEAAAGGKVLELLAQAGDVVAVGSPIATVGAEGEQASGAQPKSEGRAEPKSEDAPAQTRNPEGMAEAQRGGQPGPTPPPTPEQVSGTQPPLNVQHGGDGEVHGGNGDYPGGIKASPVARRLADDRGLDLRQVKGSGPGGRIVRRDVEDFPVGEAPAAPVESQPAAAPARQATAPIPAPMPGPTFGEIPSGPDVEVLDISKLRRRIGQRMVESKQQVPHFYVTSDIDVAALLDLRKRMNEFADEEHKISVNDLIVKAAALTLRQFPNLNTHFYGDKVVIHKRIHIGIAVALEGGGLMNVVAHDADKTALGTMAAQNRDMIARAREGKVKPEDVTGSTFSVSNLGPYDVDFFSAIINPPESGILAIGTAKKMPVVLEDGSLGVGMRMKATLSVDHRISDGAEGGQFMKAFKDLIEEPMRLLM